MSWASLISVGPSLGIDETLRRKRYSDKSELSSCTTAPCCEGLILCFPFKYFGLFLLLCHNITVVSNEVLFHAHTIHVLFI